MFSELPTNFEYVTKRLFGQDVKVIKHCCNRADMSCCGGGGGGGCCGSLFLHVTSDCNANCFFCIAEKGQRYIADFDKLKNVVTELVNNEAISKVVLTGGEPLLHPRFADFLTMLDGYPLDWYSLNTNGTLLSQFVDKINSSKLKHINISLHHSSDEMNKNIMGACLYFDDVRHLRSVIRDDIEMRMACTITKYLHTEADIMRYITRAKETGVNNVIFRNEYRGFDKYLSVFRRIWGDLFTADICNCGVKWINGVNAEYRESHVKLKQAICDANLYVRDFIYKDDDLLGGSWEYGSQVIA